jgi:hypothetical protein
MKNFLQSFKTLYLIAALSYAVAAGAVGAQTVTHVEDFIGFALQYDAGGHLDGADLLGESPKEALCQQHNMSIISDAYAHGAIPKDAKIAAACLHVQFDMKAPIRHVIAQPTNVATLTYLAIAVGYDSHGAFIGQKLLGHAPDLNTCVKQGNDTLISSSAEIKPGQSVLIYCIPVPGVPVTPGSQLAPNQAGA